MVHLPKPMLPPNVGFSLHPFSAQKRRRSPIVLSLLLLFWSAVLGLGFAQAIEPPIGTVDPIPPQQELGQELYLENCATCHIAVPGAVLPTQAWAEILQDTRHFSIELPLLTNPTLTLVWNYLQTTSRSYPIDERLPSGVDDSRHFKALHPRVETPRPVQLSGCVTCHPGAADYNFRSLTPEWQNAP
jgi:hypothetical protein